MAETITQVRLRHPYTKIDDGIDKALIVSSRNILHNWDMRNVVNQRGLLEYVAAGYTIDRWRAPTGTVKLTNEGVEFTTDNAGAATLIQILEFPEKYAGKTLTVSMEMQSKTGQRFRAYIRASVSGVLSYAWGNDVSTDGVSVGTFTVPAGVTELYVAVQLLSADRPGAGTVLLKRAKLELGTVSTLANDPPMDYGVELAKCQRYQRKAGLSGFLMQKRFDYVSANEVACYIPVPVTMRKNPSADIIPVIYSFPQQVQQQGFEVSITAFSSVLGVSGTKQNHGLTDGVFRFNANTLFDANIY